MATAATTCQPGPAAQERPGVPADAGGASDGVHGSLFLRGVALSVWQNSPDHGASQWSRWLQRGKVHGVRDGGAAGSPDFWNR